MTFNIQSDAFSSIKKAVYELTGKIVIEENSNQNNKEAFYISSQGLTSVKSSWLEGNKERLFFNEIFQILYIGSVPYNELKKLFIILNSSIGSNKFKSLGLGFYSSTMSSQNIMSIDGGFAEFYTLQINVNYNPVLMYTEYENDDIIQYIIEDKKLGLKREGEINDI